jgi:hypothetical protein
VPDGSSLPLSEQDIRRAADETIDRYGGEALTHAANQISAFNSKGFYAIGKAWQLIREEIRMRQEFERYTQALDRNVLLSE